MLHLAVIVSCGARITIARSILDSSIDLTILILTAQGLRFDIEVLGHRLTLWQCVI